MARNNLFSNAKLLEFCGVFKASTINHYTINLKIKKKTLINAKETLVNREF